MVLLWFRISRWDFQWCNAWTFNKNATFIHSNKRWYSFFFCFSRSGTQCILYLEYAFWHIAKCIHKTYGIKISEFWSAHIQYLCRKKYSSGTCAFQYLSMYHPLALVLLPILSIFTFSWWSQALNVTYGGIHNFKQYHPLPFSCLPNTYDIILFLPSSSKHTSIVFVLAIVVVFIFL